MTLRAYFDVLKNRNFTKLWISQAASQLTNYILSFAILIRVFTLTNSTISVSLIIIAFGLATLFFGGLAGVCADRFDRKWILTIVNFLQAASIGLYFIVGGNFWSLVVITFLYSSLNQFYLPAEVSSIPNVVHKDQILIANSYFAFTGSAALITGFAFAGPITSMFGLQAPYLAGVMLLVIAALSTMLLPSLKSNVIEKKSFSFRKIWSEFWDGINHFRENKLLHFPLISLLAVQIINGMIITIAPVFMQRAIGINLQSGSFFVVAPLGIGILLGALSLGLEERIFNKKTLVFLGFMGMGLMLTTLSFIGYISFKYWFYAIIGLVIGFSNAHIFAPSHSLLQTYAHDLLRGRIYASLYILLQIAATLPTIIVGLLADQFNLYYIVAGLGLLLLAFGFLIRPRQMAGAED